MQQPDVRVSLTPEYQNRRIKLLYQVPTYLPTYLCTDVFIDIDISAFLVIFIISLITIDRVWFRINY